MTPKCAARGCRKHAFMNPASDGFNGSAFPYCGLCYKHGWMYSTTNQEQYSYRCTVGFKVWSAGDVAVWLEWVGL